MQESSLLSTLWLVPLYPLAAFVLISLGRSLPAPVNAGGEGSPLLAKREVAMGLTVGATLMGLVHALAAGAWLIAQPGGSVVPLEHNWQWLQAGSLSLSVGTLLDAPSVMMLLVVTFVSLFIQIYTHGYMNHDKGYAKFYSFLALFNFSMLGLVLSTNLVQMYMFWELVGVSSYLLIGFWFHKPAAAAASMKAFMMNRVGDLGFLLGILLLLGCSIGWWGPYLAAHPGQGLLSFNGLGDLAAYLTSAASHVPSWVYTAMGALLFMGPMAKSAQVPLHTWLPDAMEGPTPISALIHAATMVAAGVFLVGRLFPLFHVDPGIMGWILAIGVLTAVVGASIAMVQTDIKKALAYSTMSQLGFMMAAMGLGAYTAALFHLLTHAFFKAMLFLGSGSVIHACEDEQDMTKMGGLWSKLPVTAITYLIGTIAISGLFWTSGFWSKDEILLAAQASPHGWVYGVLAATAGVTAFYMFRTFFLTFCGTYRGEAHVHHEDPVMTTPLLVLAVPSAIAGLLLAGVFPGLPSVGAYLAPPITAVSHQAHHAVTGLAAFVTPMGIRSQVIGLMGLALAFLLYVAQPALRSAIKRPFASLHTLFSNKWYFDDVFQGLIEGGYLMVAQVSSAFDRFVIDGTVHTVAASVSATGTLLRRIQSGRVQTYVMVLAVSLLVLTALLLLVLK
jgi:proton-translocating NADH-quinone oxidoreductase chain L